MKIFSRNQLSNAILKKLMFVTMLANLFMLCGWSMALDYVNAIPNGDFESGQMGWTGTVQQVTVDGQTVYVGVNNVTQASTIPLRPNTTYNVCCRFKEASGSPIYATSDALFGIVLYDNNGYAITNSNQTIQQPQNNSDSQFAEGISYSPAYSVWYVYLRFMDQATALSTWGTCNFTFTTGNNTASGKVKLIRLNAAATYYYDKVEIYERPVREYLQNGSFEGTVGWGTKAFGWNRVVGSGSNIIANSSTDDSGFGAQYLRMTGTEVAVGTYDKVIIKPNTQYTFSSILRVSAVPATTPALLGVKFYDKSGTLITAACNGLTYSSSLSMHYKYISCSDLAAANTWTFWKTTFLTPPGAYLADVYLYKWNTTLASVDADQLSLTSDKDATALGNYGFEATGINGFISQWAGPYTLYNSYVDDGRYALEALDTNYGESNYIPVSGNGYYLFRTWVMQPLSNGQTNSAYFSIEVFDSNKNSLGQTVTVNNLTAAADGVRWYSYLYGTPLDSAFLPPVYPNPWGRYERWFKLPATACYVKVRLRNSFAGYSTAFDNTALRKLDYRTSAQAGTKSMVLWYGDTDTWPGNTYFGTPPASKTAAFYPYIAHATTADVDINGTFDHWMIESVVFMGALPTPQDKTDWDAFLDRVFGSSGDEWLLNLNQAVVDMGGKLNDSTHKVNVIISIPLDSANYSASDFTGCTTDQNVADWYYNDVITRWNNIKNSVPRLNLLGFYLQDEGPQNKAAGFIKAMSGDIKAGGYKLYAAPYTNKISEGSPSIPRDLSGVSNFQPEFYDAHYVQSGYFDATNDASSLVDYTFIWSGVNNCGVDLEWNGNDLLQTYLDRASTYGMEYQDTSYMLYECGGWLYHGAVQTGTTERNLYDNLDKLLHNNL